MFVNKLNNQDFQRVINSVFDDKKYEVDIEKNKWGVLVTIKTCSHQKPKYLFSDFEVLPANEWANDGYNLLFKMNFKWIQYLKAKFEEYKIIYDAKIENENVNLKKQMELDK